MEGHGAKQNTNCPTAVPPKPEVTFCRPHIHRRHQKEKARGRREQRPVTGQPLPALTAREEGRAAGAGAPRRGTGGCDLGRPRSAAPASRPSPCGSGSPRCQLFFRLFSFFV